MYQLKSFTGNRISQIILLLDHGCGLDNKILLIYDTMANSSTPRITEHPDDQYVVKNEPATLNCKAEGEPDPVISWYKNGEPVITANDNPASHRMLLPSGQLFFLRVMYSRSSIRSSDVGIYYCNATNPRTGVSVVSKNASLLIATIRDDFRQQPRDLDVSVGDPAVLQCRPPRGDPEPKVRWLRNGVQLQADDERMTMYEDGRIEIRRAIKEDSGIYTCLAYNVGGQKESDPARLTVMEKPRILDGEREMTVSEGADVVFRCSAVGDPEPAITWTRLKDFIPEHRSRILEDRSLKIRKVKVQDEGIYVCRVGNSIGWQEVEFKLSVLAQPSILKTPVSQAVGVGRKATFECEVTGNPQPAVFWKRENSAGLMFPEQDYGRFTVGDDGTLVIDPVLKQDADNYFCQAQSSAGTAEAKAKLDVKDSDVRPPPLIHVGPQNQTLPISSMASMQCTASGDPPPSIRWFKNSRVLPFTEQRFSLLDTGTLQIAELRKSDTGWYTCKAISETGESSWSAALIVEAPTNPSIIFHRTPEPSTYPGAPSRPVVSEVEETTVRLSWKSNPNHGASHVSSYTVEYFSHETGDGWAVSSDSITDLWYQVKGLKANTGYRFLVRARNSHGLSIPSPITAIVKTKGDNTVQSKLQNPLNIAPFTSKVPPQIIHLHTPDTVTATSIELKWEVRKNQRYIEGYHIKYCALSDLDSQANRGPDLQAASFAIQTVQDPSARFHVIRDIKPNTRYLIFLQPFFHSLDGPASNTVYAQTLEDVPSGPPLAVKGLMYHNNTMKLTWDPPLAVDQNGPVIGYKIYICANDTQYSSSFWVNSSVLSLHIPSLSLDSTYQVQVSAQNKIGEGPLSEIIDVGHNVKEYDIRGDSPPWLLTAVILCIGCTLWLTLCSLVICLYRRKQRAQKFKDSPATNRKPNGLMSQLESSMEKSMTNSVENTYENISPASALSTSTKTFASNKKPPNYHSNQSNNDTSSLDPVYSSVIGQLNDRHSVDPFSSGLEPFLQAYMIKPRTYEENGSAGGRYSQNSETYWNGNPYLADRTVSSYSSQPPPVYFPHPPSHSPSQEMNKFMTTDRVAQKRKKRNSRLIDHAQNNRNSRQMASHNGNGNFSAGNPTEHWMNGQYQHFDDYLGQIHSYSDNECSSPIEEYCENERGFRPIHQNDEMYQPNFPGHLVNTYDAEVAGYNRVARKPKSENKKTKMIKEAENGRYSQHDNNTSNIEKCIKSADKMRVASQAQQYAASEPDTPPAHRRLAADEYKLGLNHLSSGGVLDVGSQRCFSDTDGMVEMDMRGLYGALQPPSPAPEDEGQGQTYEEQEHDVRTSLINHNIRLDSGNISNNKRNS